MAHHSLAGNRKRKKLCRELGLSKPLAVGHLVCFWWQVYEDKGVMPDGLLPRWSADDIEEAAEWDGEPGVLIAAMVKVRFLERIGETFAIHDYADWAPKYVQERWKRAKWTRQADGVWVSPNGKPCRVHDEYTASTRCVHNIPLTQPNPTQPNPVSGAISNSKEAPKKQAPGRQAPGATRLEDLEEGLPDAPWALTLDDPRLSARGWTQLLTYRLCEAFDLLKDADIGRQLKPFLKVGWRLVKHPRRADIGENLVELACAARKHTANPIPAWQKDVNQRLKELGE